MVSIPFLDTIVKPEVDGSPVHNCIQETHTYWPVFTVGQPPSPLSQVQCYPNTLSHRPLPCAAILSCSKKKRITSGRLSPSVNILKWALDKVEKRLNRSSRQVNGGGNNNAQSANYEVQNKGHIVIPYTQGLCESIKKICGRYGIQTHFKGGRTIKNLLVSPKDKDPMVKQSGAI